MKKAYDQIKIEYSVNDRNTFRICFIDDDNVIYSHELTSLDAARIHHVLANIEESLRYDIKWSSDQLSATEPLLTIQEAQFSLFINRLEVYERFDSHTETLYFPFKGFNDIDQVKNYFAEAQYS